MRKTSTRKRHERILLPNGCSMSTPAVHPANWKQVSASVAKAWYFTYRFYDPVRCPAGKQVMLKGMNDYKSLAARRQATEQLLSDEMEDLKRGFSPVLKKVVPIENLAGAGELNEDTPFILALRLASQSITCANSTKRDIRGMLHWIPLATQALRLDQLPVGQVKEKHVLRILEKCSQIKSRWDAESQKTITCGWSVHKFNKYRSNLMILFKKIKRIGAIEVNPCKDMDKEEDKAVKPKKVTLSKKQRIAVDEHLQEEHPAFRRFINIFFHSGARETEILLVKGKDVDLDPDKQVFIRIVQKGTTFREVPTTIKDIALHFWQEAMQNCGPEDYVFGRGFVAGPRSIQPARIGRVWKKLVKDDLGIDVDPYSLKYSNTTETAEIAGDEAAAAQNAHTTTAMVVKIYDVGRDAREHERLKKVNNPFVCQ
jgi:site-specific recombinase XerC